MPKKSEKPAPQRLEEALSELEQIVEKMESPDLALEESMELFERGHKLSLVCEERLQEADRKVEILLKKTDRPSSAEDFKKKNFLEDSDENFQ